MSHERRHFVRVIFDAPALLTTASGAFNVHVLDLSLKGALVRLSASAVVEPGMPCQLTVSLADTDTCIAMSAEVAHTNSSLHTGLLCRSIDLDSVTHLRRLIELQLGDPALLKRDLAELIYTPAAPV